ncbi:S8 family serine peptidase, partial [bacterium]|nr:S8 family serine peptidase [bacterium]
MEEMMKVNFKYFGIFLILFVITNPFASSNMVLAQEGRSAQVIETLLQNTKIVRPEMVLKDFMDGKTITRVIVNLSKPASFQQSTNFNDMELRKELQESVGTAQDMVINIVDPGEFRVTNRFTYIFGFSAEVTLDGLQELTQIEEVISINKDRILEPHLAQGIPLMNASTVRNTYNGSGISIAICDTGIDYTHPMLGDGGFPNTKVIGGYDCGDNDADPMDEEGHGTCCAGIAAGDLGFTGDYIGGVAYNARLYALKISYGSGGSAYTSDMIEAWEWCITYQNDDLSNPIMVISTSFGGGYYTSTCDSDTPAMTAAAANCVAAGMTLFVSSGNDGFCDGMGWPACITHVNAVGAVY